MKYYVNDASYVEGIPDEKFRGYAKISSSKKAEVKNKPKFTPLVHDDNVIGVLVDAVNTTREVSIYFDEPLKLGFWNKFMIPVEDYVPYELDINEQAKDKLRELIKQYGDLCAKSGALKSEASEMMESNPIGGAKLYKKAGNMVTPLKRELFDLIEKLELK